MDLTRAVVDAKDSCQELTDSCKEMSDSCQDLADSYKSLQAMAADLLSSWERFKVQQAAATSSRTTTTTPPPTSTTPPPTPPPQATPTPEEAPASYSIPTMSAVAPHTATAVILQLPTRCSTLGVAHDAGGIDDKVALVEPATVEAWPTIALQFWVQHVPAPARPLVHPRQGPPKNPVPAGDCDSRCFDDNGRLFLTSSFRPSIDAIERGDFSPWKNARYIGRCLPDNLSSLSPGRYKTMRLIELQHLGVTDMGSLWDSIAKNWLVTVIIVARQACDGLKNSTADAIHSITVFFLPHKILELVSSRPPWPPTNCSKRNAFSRVNNGWQSMHLVMNNFLLWRHIDFILKEVGVFAIQVQSMAAILMRPWDPGVVDLFSMNILVEYTSNFSRMLAEYEKLLEVTVQWKFPLLCLATQDKSPISGSVYQIIVMQAWFDHMITVNHLLFTQGSELVFFHSAANGQVALGDSDSILHAAIDFVHSSTLVLLWNQEHVCHDLSFRQLSSENCFSRHMAVPNALTSLTRALYMRILFCKQYGTYLADLDTTSVALVVVLRSSSCVVAYKLQLPPGSQIHRVVHVSLLKKASPANSIAQPDLPLQCLMVGSAPTPLQIMDTRYVASGKSLIPMVQIQWSGLPNSWLTWENKHWLMQDFLSAPAWGQADSQEGGNVTAHPSHVTREQPSEAQSPRVSIDGWAWSM